MFFESPSNSCSDTRSLYEIVSTCLVTLLACTYVSVHPNVPKTHGKENLFLIRVKLMALALVAPELLVSWAFRQWLVARKVTEYDSKLSLTHGFFLSMGGFKVTFSGSNSRCLTIDDLRPSAFAPTRSLAAISFAASPPNSNFNDFLLPHQNVSPSSNNKVDPGSNAHENSDSSTDGPSGSSHIHPRNLPLIYCSHLANVDESEILDKSKTDPFSKGIALCQILWFLTACIARPVVHLSVTPLEVTTIAFATLNVVMYLIWWRKPLNVERPINIHASDLSDHSNSDETFEPKLSLKDWIRRTVMNWDSQTNSYLEAGKLSDGYQYLALAVSAIMAMVFGAVHLVAWNTIFPSSTERILWLCSAIITVIVPILFAVVWAVSYNLVQVVKRRRSVHMPQFVVNSLIFFHRHFLPVLSLLYAFARLFLLVLPFILLRDLPPASYCTTSWTRFLPHFSS